MLTKRIIPCLDVKDGRTVKGINFEGLRDAGDPVALGALYAKQGADELVFLDISATNEGRGTFAELVKEIAAECTIPFTVGGGINSIQDVDRLLKAGADKVSINSSAVKNPDLINQLSKEFGSQCIVLAIDARQEEESWLVYTHGGKKATDKELFSWAQEGQQRGAGEILFTSMNNDGTKNGFAIAALKKMNELLTIPIIASGGAGTMDHFVDVFKNGGADAALAASVFHFGEISLHDLKSHLRENNIAIRN
ncbi:MAG: imidazole glycerol phosphate synthase subunit HisF [Cyclobacteriaceae bacterium]